MIFDLKRLPRLAAALTAASLLPAAAGCDYFGRPEPVLERDLGEIKTTADREPAVMTYGKDSLGDGLEAVYEVLEERAAEEESVSFVADCPYEDFNRVFDAYRADHPEVFWLDAESPYAYIDYGDSCEIDLRFAFEGDDLAHMRGKLSAAADEILAAAPPAASDYEIELYLNDYLTQHVSYDKEAPMLRDPYGALIYGKAVCAGYAKAFQYLCNRAGLDCVCVYGSILRVDEDSALEANSFHEWNAVQIEGDWYFADVTWNDSFKEQSHGYLNVTSKEIGRSRETATCWGDGDDPGEMNNVFVPECTATAFNYYNKTGAVISDPADDNDVIACLTAAAKQGRRYADFRVANDRDFAQTAREIGELYGYRWLEAANHYNRGDPAVRPDAGFYAHEQARVINFIMDYQ